MGLSWGRFFDEILTKRPPSHFLGLNDVNTTNKGLSMLKTRQLRIDRTEKPLLKIMKIPSRLETRKMARP
jgi:hypothetical protein